MTPYATRRLIELHEDMSLTPAQMMGSLEACIQLQMHELGTFAVWPTLLDKQQLTPIIRHLLWHFVGVSGGIEPGAWTKDLISVISHADRLNYNKLMLVFPVHCILYRHVQQHGAWVLQRAVGVI